MSTLHVRVETMEEFGAGFVDAMNDVIAGRPRASHEGVSFGTYEDMYAVFSPSRLAMINMLAGQGALSIRELARRLERDVQAVHRDVTRLINAGIVERTKDGVRFDYDEIDFAFKLIAGKAGPATNASAGLRQS